ncbi:hypothetical protein BB561_004259 [Smittium simulii]|uniref:Amino acid permease/ SLC12A domain-containing protein n=1 Tax=Smittium simulii TaxID=133385 RepID=A0A2T9YH78_9FUNG|nr:hypothetical protein BB561_004259 [Smittium simulii]
MSEASMKDLEATGYNDKTTYVQQDKLTRSLKGRHMAMIALGGTIGTGLFVASGASLTIGGPGGSLAAYLGNGIIMLFVMTSLGEMSTFIPIAGSFNSFGERFVDKSYGFAVAYNYWYSWIVASANDLVAAGIVMQYWLPNINPIIWSIIVFVMVIIFNLFGSKVYGESEFWLSIIKVVAIVVFIVIGILVASGIIGGVKYGFTNWGYRDGPFVGGFRGFLSVYLYAGFSFNGTEIVGITSGESENPSRDIPRAIRSIFWRILLFYVITILLIGMIIPYDNPNLLNTGVANIAVSPLVLVLKLAGIKAAPDIMNAVILTSVLSAANSGLYLTSRTLYSLSIEGKGPRIMGRVSKSGTPIFSLIGCAFIITILFCLSLIGNKVIYTWFVALGGVSGMINWMGILFTQNRFRRGYILQGYNMKDLPYVANFYPYAQYFSFFLLGFFVLAQGQSTFIDVKFDVSGFLKTYLGIPIFLGMWIIYKLVNKIKLTPLSEIDYETENYISLGFPNNRHDNNTLKSQLISFFT